SSPETVGPFRILGTLGGTDGHELLRGEDPVLGRPVLIWRCHASAEPLPEARQEVNRTTRPRWLAGGAEGDARWDAFGAGAGLPLPDLAAQPGRSTAVEDGGARV